MSEIILYIDNTKYDPTIKCNCECINEHDCCCCNNCSCSCDCIKCSFTEEEIKEIKKRIKTKYLK